MIAVWLVAVFLTVVLTGPDGVDWMKRRRARLDRPTARVVYLPSAACRIREELTNDDEDRI